MTANEITFHNVDGYPGKTVTISLSGILKSMVFMPNLYLNGIEAIEYPWLHQVEMRGFEDLGIVDHNAFHFSRTRSSVAQDIDILNIINPDDKGNFVTETAGRKNWLPDYNSDNKKVVSTAGWYEFKKGKTITVAYHLNPANATVAYSDNPRFNVLESDVVYTRAAASDLDVTSPEKLLDDKTAAFGASDGVLTVGLNVAKPWNLNADPVAAGANKDNVIALQMNSATENGVTPTITSDYALLQPVKARIEGLVWNPEANVVLHGDETCVGDEGSGTITEATRVHVWDSPKEALVDNRGAALEVYYDDANGINLKNQLALHIEQQNIKKTGMPYELLKSVTPAEAEKWGLRFEFNLVDYKIGANVTKDSHYAKWVGNKNNGVLRAWNVRLDGNAHPDGTTASAIGREPLVQVLVKDTEGHVVLDGYILLHIGERAAVKTQTTAEYAQNEVKFTMCNNLTLAATTWSEFDANVLQGAFEPDMKKDDFDAQYTPVDINGFSSAASGATKYEMKQFTSNAVDATPVAAAHEYGKIYYTKDELGTTNHTFRWEMTKEQVEELTHHKAETILTRYVRLNGTGAGAKFNYVYVKLSVKITRENLVKAMNNKIDQYWFHYADVENEKRDNGWDAIVFDATEPVSGGTTLPWAAKIQSTFEGNKALATTGKFYFVPETRTVTRQDTLYYEAGKPVLGKSHTYVISPVTPFDGSDKLYCKYITAPIADQHPYPAADKLAQLLEDCAINYSAGAFANRNLYVSKDGGSWEHIATMNQTTGVITLNNTSKLCKEALNAVGYEENHTNINDELRALVGLVTEHSTGCDVASAVADKAHGLDGTFNVSFQRPINPWFKSEIKIDAKAEGNTIDLVDYIEMFDWRGPKHGNMMTNRWFWAFYDVNGVTIDMDNVYTTLGDGKTWRKLNEVTTQAELYALLPAGGEVRSGVANYSFDLSGWNSSAQNNALITHMNTNKGEFGRLYYKNNGANVTDFKISVPVTIKYAWGEATKRFNVHIVRTQGN